MSASLVFYPELLRVPPDRRPALLTRARHEPFDWVELAGLGAAVVVVAWCSEAIGGEMGAAAAAVIAIPLVLACAGPFYWRRTRRAIREALARDARGEAA